MGRRAAAAAAVKQGGRGREYFAPIELEFRRGEHDGRTQLCAVVELGDLGRVVLAVAPVESSATVGAALDTVNRVQAAARAAYIRLV